MAKATSCITMPVSIVGERRQDRKAHIQWKTRYPRQHCLIPNGQHGALMQDAPVLRLACWADESRHAQEEDVRRGAAVHCRRLAVVPRSMPARVNVGNENPWERGVSSQLLAQEDDNTAAVGQATEPSRRCTSNFRKLVGGQTTRAPLPSRCGTSQVNASRHNTRPKCEFVPMLH